MIVKTSNQEEKKIDIRILRVRHADEILKKIMDLPKKKEEEVYFAIRDVARFFMLSATNLLEDDVLDLAFDEVDEILAEVRKRNFSFFLHSRRMGIDLDKMLGLEQAKEAQAKEA